MTRKSSIDRLPPEIRETIGELRRQGRTIDEILAKLDELHVDVSRSALGRYTKDIDRIAEEVHRNRAIAEALVDRFGEAPDNKAARMNIELMHSLITRIMFNEDSGMVRLEPQEAYFLATGLQRLAQAQKVDVDRMTKIREQLQAQVDAKLKKVEGELEAEQAGTGAPADLQGALKRIREEVYGVFA